MFSLGARELPNVRSLVGNVHAKDVDVAITNKAGVTKTYRLSMRQYLLRDEANGLSHRGQWKIVNFEPLS